MHTPESEHWSQVLSQSLNLSRTHRKNTLCFTLLWWLCVFTSDCAAKRAEPPNLSGTFCFPHVFFFISLQTNLLLDNAEYSVVVLLLHSMMFCFSPLRLDGLVTHGCCVIHKTRQRVGEEEERRAGANRDFHLATINLCCLSLSRLSGTIPHRLARRLWCICHVNVAVDDRRKVSLQISARARAMWAGNQRHDNVTSKRGLIILLLYSCVYSQEIKVGSVLLHCCNILENY